MADDADSRARFLLEAEVTGRLEHPGIVPVYGLGTDDDDQPFYAMRFVRGTSFEEAIRRFHAADEDPRRDPRERSMSLRHLLDRFVDVCQTVAYAHSRGVLHRDLKPANILLRAVQRVAGRRLGPGQGLHPRGGRTADGRPQAASGGRGGGAPSEVVRCGVEDRIPVSQASGASAVAAAGWTGAGRLVGRPGAGAGFVRAAAGVLELDRHCGGDGVRHAGLRTEPGTGGRAARPARARQRRVQPGGDALYPPGRAGRRSNTSGAMSRPCSTGSG